MELVIRKKDKELKTTRKQAQIGKRNDTTTGVIQTTTGLIEDSRCSIYLKLWDGLASRCCTIRLGGLTF